MKKFLNQDALMKLYKIIKLPLFFWSSLFYFSMAAYVGKEPRILMISIPKSGTHMLKKLLWVLTEEKWRYWIPKNYIIHQKHIDEATERIIAGHVICSEHNQKITHKNQLKVFFIYRDPRDTAVSMAHWILSKPKQHPSHQTKSFDQLLMEIITSGSSIWYRKNNPCKELLTINGIADFYHLYLGWINNSQAYPIRFEDLVGAQGGGSKKAQIQVITEIAQLLGLDLSKNQIRHISNNLFGGTSTFRQGEIGSWKKEFKPEHKRAFKEKAGKLLIDLGYEKDLTW